MAFLLSCLFLLATLAGCATLPDTGDIIYGPLDVRTPRVVDARGELSPERSKRIVERLQRQSGSTELTARQSIVLEAMTALTDAAKRGVDVRLIVPGVSNHGLVFYAGRSRYEDLLESGVKLYERRGGMLHAKTAVIDGVWSTVGSTNLDLWSFARNDEVNAVILGREFADEMEAMFAADIEASNEIRREEWKGRPLTGHIKEWFSRLLSYWL
jgi:phosphatidylserine/phosphatidylglycerophosphate/cardiolipin synthase-like enzyme